MGFEVQARTVGAVAVLDAVGQLTTIDGHTKMRDLVYVLTRSGTKRFVLNLGSVEFIDSSGIGELLRSYFVVRQAAGDLKLACLNAHALEVLNISHMNTVFDIYGSEAEALRAFGQRV